ncbi:MAG: hypothetical protein K8R53_06970, partial [Bacteroidales bacterium]|nr:hypothetical protein [Bacteroidales bacterium]
ALYVIGFCENFLGIENISTFFGLPPNKDSFRIVGSGILLLLVIIAYISTSLAIKAQYLILSFILLSLVSIFAGFFMNIRLQPATIPYNSVDGGQSLEFVFAVFFPAVTGFTAGVAMSGDLKDPRKNIPFGTLAAIFVGLVVYVLLAIGMALFVDRELLLTDKNFLMKTAWFAPLVVAGIWGATLSSALGGILGGPRILQAISKDKITPKVFARGYGASNEPRNALILTFIIAEAGILIGELNVIARLVSMFYITAYGFINLSFALERWASSDFRPSFRISRWVGIIGFLACFSVMFKIDTIAMVGAMVVISGIYFFLKNKMLEFDFGDVWQSVWSSVVRSTLHEMDRKQEDERNWRPNIMLFSGSTFARPFLIEFGKDLAGNHGFISNFDLIENKEADVLFPKHEQSIQTEDSRRFKGVFTRKQQCRDFYDGIEIISRTYGFAGIEPNTVLMAWARQAKNPEKFAVTIRVLTELDLNVLMMDYDENAGFGNKERIDIWWRGRGNNGNLALSMVKFIWLSENWRNSKVRLLIVNPVNSEKKRILYEAAAVLENIRINAEIKVINNELEQKTFYEIIENESSGSDLIFLGIPEIELGKELEFVQKTNDLCTNIGTVILIKSSSRFRELNIGVVEKAGIKPDAMQEEINKVLKGEDKEGIYIPEDEMFAGFVRSLNETLRDFANHHFYPVVKNFLNDYKDIYSELEKIFEDRFDSFENKAVAPFKGKAMAGIQTVLIRSFTELLLKDIEDIENKHRDLLAKAFTGFSVDMDAFLNRIPARIIKKVDQNLLIYSKEDKYSVKWRKWRIRNKMLSSVSKDGYNVPYQKLVEQLVLPEMFLSVYSFYSGLGLFTFRFTNEILGLIDMFMSTLSGLTRDIQESSFNKDMFEQEKKLLLKNLHRRNNLMNESFNRLFISLMNDINDSTGKFARDIERWPVYNPDRRKQAGFDYS